MMDNTKAAHTKSRHVKTFPIDCDIMFREYQSQLKEQEEL